jgi:hypothetical protein
VRRRVRGVKGQHCVPRSERFGVSAQLSEGRLATLSLSRSSCTT